MKRMQGDALLQAAERAYGGDVASDEDSSDEDDEPGRAPLNAFALLGGDDDEEDEEAVENFRWRLAATIRWTEGEKLDDVTKGLARKLRRWAGGGVARAFRAWAGA